MKKIWLVLILFSPVALGISQVRNEIDGTIFDAQTGKPVSQASVRIRNTSIGTYSDLTGHYHLKGIPVSLQKFVLSVSYTGYRQQDRNCSKKDLPLSGVNFQLKEDVINLNDVVVSADRNEVDRKDAPVIVGVINSKTFDMAGAVCLSQGLNFQTGIRVEDDCQNCGYEQVRMNGLDGDYSQILIDSRPIFSALSGVYGLEQIPVNMIERVEVVRGGGSALFGSNAIAGTINIITKDPKTNGISVSHDLELIDGKSSDNMLQLGASFVSQDKQTGTYLFGSFRDRNYLDYVGDGYSEIPILKNNTIGMRSFYNLSSRSKFILEYHNIHEFRRGGDKFDLEPDKTDITEQIEHYINGGGMNYTLNSLDNHKHLNVYFSAQQINRKSYYGAGEDPNAYGKTSDMTYVGGAQYTQNFNKFLFAPSDLTFGSEYQYDALHDIMLGYNRDLQQTTKVVGLFLQNEWKLGKLKLLLGSRLDKHNLLKHVVLSPRLNAKYDFNQDLHWRGSFAMGFRAPQAFDEDLHIEAVDGTVKLIELSPDLRPEKSFAYSTSLDYFSTIAGIRNELLVELFTTRIKDIFVLSPKGKNTSGELVYERENGSGGNVSGVSLEEKMQLFSRMALQVGFTMQRSIYDSAQAWSSDSSISAERHMLRSPNHYGYMSLSVGPFGDFNFALTATETGSMLVPHLKGYIPQDVLTRSKSFLDAGFKTSYSHPISASLKMTLSAGVKNFLNSYQKDFDKGRYRDSGYIYGPATPRTYFISLKIEG